MKPARRILDRLQQRQLTTGAILIDQLFPEMVEHCSNAGLDYLIICREHGAFGDELVAQVCALGRMTDFAVLMRPLDCTYPTIRRAIDMGPCGFLLPAVESAEDLDIVRDAIYLPPRGSRRPGGPGNYWVSGFFAENWKSEVEDDLIVIPQIETVRGLENAEEIAAHELVTAIGIGPYDLSHSISVNFRMDDSKFLAAVERIKEAGNKAGKQMWRIGHGPTLAQEGYRFICIGDPIGHMKGLLAQIQTETAAAAV